MVETETGERAIAARYESAFNKNTYLWGAVLNKAIVGNVEKVAFWYEEKKWQD